MAKTPNRRCRFLRAVDEILVEGADDAMPAGINLADLFRIATGGLDDPRCRGIDDCRNAARLGVKSVARRGGRAAAAAGRGGGFTAGWLCDGLFHGSRAYRTV